MAISLCDPYSSYKQSYEGGYGCSIYYVSAVFKQFVAEKLSKFLTVFVLTGSFVHCLDYRVFCRI